MALDGVATGDAAKITSILIKNRYNLNIVLI
jgi:hypothetical protein